LWAGATHFQSALHLFGSNGALVKKVAGGVTTVYIGNHHENREAPSSRTIPSTAGGLP